MRYGSERYWLGCLRNNRGKPPDNLVSDAASKILAGEGNDMNNGHVGGYKKSIWLNA